MPPTTAEVEQDLTWQRLALAVVVVIVVWTVLRSMWTLLAEWAREAFRFSVHMTLWSMPMRERASNAVVQWMTLRYMLWIAALAAVLVWYFWKHSEEWSKNHPVLAKAVLRTRAEMLAAARFMLFLTLYSTYFVAVWELFRHQVIEQTKVDRDVPSPRPSLSVRVIA